MKKLFSPRLKYGASALACLLFFISLGCGGSSSLSGDASTLALSSNTEGSVSVALQSESADSTSKLSVLLRVAPELLEDAKLQQKPAEQIAYLLFADGTKLPLVWEEGKLHATLVKEQAQQIFCAELQGSRTYKLLVLNTLEKKEGQLDLGEISLLSTRVSWVVENEIREELKKNFSLASILQKMQKEPDRLNKARQTRAKFEDGLYLASLDISVKGNGTVEMMHDNDFLPMFDGLIKRSFEPSESGNELKESIALTGTAGVSLSFLPAQDSAFYSFSASWGTSSLGTGASLHEDGKLRNFIRLDHRSSGNFNTTNQTIEVVFTKNPSAIISLSTDAGSSLNTLTEGAIAEDIKAEGATTNTTTNITNTGAGSL